MARTAIRTLVGVLLAQAAVGTALATADGLPVLGVQGSNQGVELPSGAFRYVTHPAGRGTRMQELSRSGRVITTGTLPGRFVVPVVAYDGSPAGLSADGRTLVLIRPRVAFPQSISKLAIVEARTLRARLYLRLRGDFSFDAISPAGRWIYLIQYTSPVDPTRYRVRALDVDTGRFAPHDIIDPYDRSDAMRGHPITRAASLDGRWAYTLYDGAGHPFVHVLDTAGRRARCIDVPPFPANVDPWTARLELNANQARLLVTITNHPLAVIDTRTLTLSDTSPGNGRPRTRELGAKSAWLGEALPIAAILAILAGVTVLIRRRPRGPLDAADAP